MTAARSMATTSSRASCCRSRRWPTRSRSTARLRAAIRGHDILRVKGFLAVAGKPMRHVVQAVGERVDRYYDRPWRAGEAAAGELVVIGLKGLDRAAIADAILARPAA